MTSLNIQAKILIIKILPQENLADKFSKIFLWHYLKI